MGNPFYPRGNQPQGNQNGFQTIPGLPNLNDAPPEVRGDIGQLFNWFASNLQGNPQQIMQNMFAGGLMNNGNSISSLRRQTSSGGCSGEDNFDTSLAQGCI